MNFIIELLLINSFNILLIITYKFIKKIVLELGKDI